MNSKGTQAYIHMYPLGIIVLIHNISSDHLMASHGHQDKVQNPCFAYKGPAKRWLLPSFMLCLSSLWFLHLSCAYFFSTSGHARLSHLWAFLGVFVTVWGTFSLCSSSGSLLPSIWIQMSLTQDNFLWYSRLLSLPVLCSYSHPGCFLCSCPHSVGATRWQDMYVCVPCSSC